MFSVYWRFWWSFTWRTYLILFSILALTYLLIAFASSVQTGLQTANTLMFILGPFIQVYVLKKIFQNKKLSFDVSIVDKVDRPDDNMSPWNPR